MTVNPKGEIIDHTITESVICVDRRMTYTNVKKILAGRDPVLVDAWVCREMGYDKDDIKHKY